MGIRVGLFCDDISEDLLCSACDQVYLEPMTLKCGDFFCKQCIENLLRDAGDEKARCPLDGERFDESTIRPPHSLLANVLAGLKLRCKFYPDCFEAITYTDYVLQEHESKCDFNPINKEHNEVCDECSAILTLTTKPTHTREECRKYFLAKISKIKSENEKRRQQNERLKAEKLEASSKNIPVKNDASPFVHSSENQFLSRETCLRKLNYMIRGIQSFVTPTRVGIEWEEGLFVKSMLSLIEPNRRIDEILGKTDLSHFFYMKLFYRMVRASKIKNNPSLFIHILLLDLVEPLIQESSKVLILDYIDHGISQWIAQICQLVTTAVFNPEPFIEANKRLEPALREKVNYVSYRRNLNDLIQEIDKYSGHSYDFIIDFSLHTDFEIHRLMTKFGNKAILIRFTRDPFGLRIYSWLSGNKICVRELLCEKDFVSFRVAVPKINGLE